MSFTKQAKILAVGLFLLAGTISTFGTYLFDNIFSYYTAYKLQGSVQVTQGLHTKNFFHPYMQSFTMFIGQAICLLIYLTDKQRNSVVLQKGKQPHKLTIFFIPALADSCSSILQYMGLTLISGSTYMMFKGASIVTTALFSKVLINMKLEKRHFVGCGLAILGIIIVGTSGFLQSDSKGDSTFQKQLVGYILMLISLIFNGFFYAYQQYLLKKHTINPLQMVGFEGIFGLGIILTITTILSFIPCSFQPSKCVFDSQDNSFFQLPLVFFKQIFTHLNLFIMITLGLISIGIYNLNGLRITKMFDALTRSLLNVTKTSIIWVIGIIITLASDDLKLQSLNIGVNAVKAVGFAVIIVGTLIYNKLLFKNYFAAEQSNGQDQFQKNYATVTSDDGSIIDSERLINKSVKTNQ